MSKPPARSSRPKAAIVEQSSSDDDEPIAPFFKRPRTQAAASSVVSTIIRDIVEVSDVQSSGDEPIPDVPAEFTGEVSGFTDNSPEAINAESSQVEGEASEAQPPVDEVVEVEAAELPAELPAIAVQADQSEALAEEAEGAQDFGVVGEGTAFIDVESRA
ncbi:hypothetical protein Nepgr_015460 [Nepenthes gracilis]|uniref:Uncharacterized protein n=1 Tax=Nepenthes gracilis TaxID=150966 RepID=A0AAD3XR47_NEPGR|nr:hypothetical protein Nepgr_015460 [Nepenthes gracilis]